MKKEVSEALELLNDLQNLMSDRISDLHEVKGGMQARHCYMFYRSKLWEIRDVLRKIEK